MEVKHCNRLLPTILHIIHIVVVVTQLLVDCTDGEVRVKIYDHRAYHDPIEWYGKGAWKYFGHGYGIDYGFDKKGEQSHERGYGFVKAFAREFCKEGNRCRPPDPHFWQKTSLTANGISPEPYFARPPADVMEPRLPQSVPQGIQYVPDPDFVADASNIISWTDIPVIPAHFLLDQNY